MINIVIGLKQINMESIVICAPSVKRLRQENSFFDFTLCNQEMTIGLIDAEDPNYTRPLSDKNILVQIDAFSCNYRDKSLLLTLNDTCNEGEVSGKYFYSAFGSEFVGKVLRVGKEVFSLKKGDRVIADATYPWRDNGDMGGVISNYASRRFQIFNENQLIGIPDCLSDVEAACFTVGAQTGYSMVRKAGLQEGQNVLVTAGSSHTSLAVLNQLKNKKVNIYVLSSNTEYKKLFPGSEKFTVIPPASLKNDTFQEDINGIKFDVVIDPFFDLHFEGLLPSMNFNSKYIFCGFHNQNKYYANQSNKSYFPPIVLAACISRNISIIGNCIGERQDLTNALRDFENGKYMVNIDSVYSGQDVLPFLQKSFHQLPRFGKVVYKY